MKKRLIAALMALCLLAGMLPAGLADYAANSFSVYIISNTLYAYRTPSTSARTLGLMSYGEEYLCLATYGDWAKIRNSSGAIGYCLKSGLSTEDPNDLNGTVYINTANTRVYAKPLTSARVMMRLAKDSGYTARAVTADGNWYRLQNGRYYGYVQSQYISTRPGDEGNNNDNGNTDQTPDLSLSTTVYAVGNLLNIYRSMSFSSGVLTTVPFGQMLTCSAVSGGWAKVSYGGATGFCVLAGLSDVNPNTLNYKVSINTANTKVYAMPSTSARVMMLLKNGASYAALAITQDDGWYRLQNGKYYGYVQSQYITDPNKTEDPEEEDPFDPNTPVTPDEPVLPDEPNIPVDPDVPGDIEETTVYVINDTLPVYAMPAENSRLLGTMSFGEDMTLLTVEDGWANVRNSSGDEGYCMYGGLSTASPNTLQDTYYVQSDGVRVYAKPLTTATVKNRYNTNVELTVVAINSAASWARVQLGNAYGYVQMENIGKSKVTTEEDEGIIKDTAETPVYVTDTLMVVYQTTDTSSKALNTMSFGESATMTGYGGGWVRIVSGGTVGYCKQSSLGTANPNKYNVTLYVQQSGVKAYAKASTASSSMGTMTANTVVTGLCVSSDKTWVRAKNSAGKIGYIQSQYLSTSSLQGGGSGGDSSKANAVVTLAKQQMNKKYVYAAEGPNEFDCSGLTYYVYKRAAGITLRRTAYQQGYDSRYASAKITSMAALRVGDLVFFNTSNDSDLCDHVGIYIGANQFIHASSAGGRVMISSMSASSSGGYYNRNFSWGLRVL